MQQLGAWETPQQQDGAPPLPYYLQQEQVQQQARVRMHAAKAQAQVARSYDTLLGYQQAVYQQQPTPSMQQSASPMQQAALELQQHPPPMLTNPLGPHGVAAAQPDLDLNFRPSGSAYRERWHADRALASDGGGSDLRGSSAGGVGSTVSQLHQQQQQQQQLQLQLQQQQPIWSTNPMYLPAPQMQPQMAASPTVVYPQMQGQLQGQYAEYYWPQHQGYYDAYGANTVTPTPGPAVPWAPWENQWTETPVHSIMKKFPRAWYRWRWAAWYPLQWRLLWGRTTFGEALFFVAALGAAGGAMAGTWKSAVGSGYVASIPLFLTFMLASHNSVWAFLFGLPFERALFWHLVAAWLTVAMGLYHGLSSWRYYDQGGGGPTVFGWQLSITDTWFITGWGLLGSIILIVATSALSKLRRWAFQPWYVAHVLLAITIVGFAFAHIVVLVAIGLGFWVLDLLIRYPWMAAFKYPKQVELTALPGDVTRIAWPKASFAYTGGQYCFICVPALSWFEWHPFSLSSHPSQDKVFLHVRALGNWTKALHKLASAQGGRPVATRVFIEGPYGSAAADICGDRHDMFLLISGGIGVTPMQSVLNDLLAQVTRGRQIKFLWFVWSVRDKAMLNTVLDCNVSQHEPWAVPRNLPWSFSPNLVSPNISLSPSMYSPVGQAQLLMGSAGAVSFHDFLHTEFYLTQPRDAGAHAVGNINASKQAALRLGRPNLPEIFKEMARVAEAKQPVGPKRVAVMVCGPRTMIDEVTRLCGGDAVCCGGGNVTFELHKEIFEL